MSNAELIATAALIISLFSVLAGARLKVDIERLERRYDLLTKVREALAQQYQPPAVLGGPDIGDLIRLRAMLPFWRRVNYDKACIKYQAARESIYRDKLNQAHYRDPQKVSDAANVLLKLLPPPKF